jgi:hypothetical protein
MEHDPMAEYRVGKTLDVIWDQKVTGFGRGVSASGLKQPD